MILQLLFSMAFASFSGTWVGEGRLTSNSANIPCQFHFEVLQTDETIDVLAQSIFCSEFAFNWKPYGAKIIGGELFNHKTGIYGGTIDKKELRVNYLMSAESAPYIINVDILFEDEADFEMILGSGDDRRFLRAIMYKKDPSLVDTK